MTDYADVYLKALEERRPEEYARRQGTPELQREAEQVDLRARAQHQNLVSQLLKQHPEPKDYASRVQHLQTLEQQARELVIDDLLPEPEPQSESSPTDQAPTIA